MRKSPLFLLISLLPAILSGSVLAAEPAAKDPPASEQAEPQPAPAPVFLGILKEGEKLPTAMDVYKAEKAKRDQAGLEAAFSASKDLAIRIGSFAMKLMIGIAIAATVGISIAAVMVFTRGRRRNLMEGKTAQSINKTP